MDAKEMVVISALPLVDALEKIVAWKAFPDVNGKSYGCAYGANGERDYMRSVAADALATFRRIPAERAGTGEPQEKCGACVIHFIAREGSFFPCALNKNHPFADDHRAEGTCFKHGVYLGEPNAVPVCPHHPNCEPVPDPAPLSPERRHLKMLREEFMTLDPAPAEGTRNGFICGVWRVCEEGPILDYDTKRRAQYVNRCDLPEGHEGDHVDSVILVNWSGPTPVAQPAGGEDRLEQWKDIGRALIDANKNCRWMDDASHVLQDVANRAEVLLSPPAAQEKGR